MNLEDVRSAQPYREVWWNDRDPRERRRDWLAKLEADEEQRRAIFGQVLDAYYAEHLTEHERGIYYGIRHLSVKEQADRAGVDPRTVIRWRQSLRPRLKQLYYDLVGPYARSDALEYRWLDEFAEFPLGEHQTRKDADVT